MFHGRGFRLLCGLLLCSLVAPAQAQQRKQSAPAQQSGDRRDQVVAAPGTPYHGRPYWWAAAQCAGIYFKLGTLYAEEATRTRAAKPDPAAAAALNRKAESAGRSSASFFEIAERFLAADRSLSQEAAVQAYDGQAATAGDRLKSIDAAAKAAEACPALHETCRGAAPKVCGDRAALTN
jgi:hypothetical protein